MITVQHPDGTVIVEHSDGTRITTYSRQVQVPIEDSAETGQYHGIQPYRALQKTRHGAETGKYHSIRVPIENKAWCRNR